MDRDPKVQKDGIKWFYSAGLIAIIFCLFLYSVDLHLTNYPYDKQLGQKLFKLRMAQTTLESSTQDPRQSGRGLRTESVNKEEKTEEPHAEEAEHATDQHGEVIVAH